MSNVVYSPTLFEKLLENLRECTSKTPKAALLYLQKSAIPWLSKKIGESSGSTKKMFEKCHNLVSSYIDGLKSGDVEPKDIRQLVKELAAERTAYEKKVADDLAKKAAKGKPADPDEDPEVTYLLNGKPGFDHGADANAVYHKYAKYRKDIPRMTTKPYLAVRVPVLALPKGIPDVSKLQGTGIVDDFLFGYPVMKNQIIIGMNYDWLKENFPQKQKTSIRTDGVKDDKIDFEGAVSRILGEVKQRTGRHHVMLGGIHGFDSPELLWVWVISDADHRRLNGTAGPGTFTVSDWTLPFPSQTQKLNH